MYVSLLLFLDLSCFILSLNILSYGDICNEDDCIRVSVDMNKHVIHRCITADVGVLRTYVHLIPSMCMTDFYSMVTRH